MAIIKFVILGLVIYFGYRAFKFWRGLKISFNEAVKKAETGRSMTRVDDVMVKDPFCEVYFPKRTGVQLKTGDDILYFCSTECRDGFLASQGDAGD